MKISSSSFSVLTSSLARNLQKGYMQFLAIVPTSHSPDSIMCKFTVWLTKSQELQYLCWCAADIIESQGAWHMLFCAVVQNLVPASYEEVGRNRATYQAGGLSDVGWIANSNGHIVSGQLEGPEQHKVPCHIWKGPAKEASAPHVCCKIARSTVGRMG